ncbi:threonylcarbamoyl-AMP synthase-like [Anolis sagrei]|uniref:threonylcarbamoyl-AMP synthase-like n=1 Tax=Anolis sagrei TaxID=38937 RepID=UPI0035228589
MAAVMKMLRVTGRLARLSPRGEDGEWVAGEGKEVGAGLPGWKRGSYPLSSPGVVGAEEASSSAACLAASALRGGCLVALPTDTVYSMACLAENSRALEALYRLKGRDPGKLLAICLPNLDLLHRFCKVHVPEGLLQDLLPGPVTLVLERSKALNPDLNTYTPVGPPAFGRGSGQH